jgi:hypothetical protein
MLRRWVIVFVWSLAVASALFWSYLIFRTPPSDKTTAQRLLPASVPRADLSRLFGTDPPPPAPTAAEAQPAPDSRMRLIGVVSPSAQSAANEGLALIVTGDHPAKVFRVGMVVEGNNVVQAVEARGVRVGPKGGASLFTLSTAPLTPPNTGVLPPPAGIGSVPAARAASPSLPIAAAPAPPFTAATPTPNAAPPGDGSPPPFGGPPSAVGVAPPAKSPTPGRPSGPRPSP